MDTDDIPDSRLTKIRDLITEHGPHWVYEKYPLSAATGTLVLAIAAGLYIEFGNPVADTIDLMTDFRMLLQNIWNTYVPRWFQTLIQNPAIGSVVFVFGVIAAIRVIDDGLGVLATDVWGFLIGSVRGLETVLKASGSGGLALIQSDFVSGVFERVTAQLIVRLILALGGAAGIAWIATIVKNAV